jgi:hypothetical protein
MLGHYFTFNQLQMKYIISLLGAALLCATSLPAQDSTQEKIEKKKETDDHIKSKADDHAPIGVMGEHIHAKGEWMVSYRYMAMNMEGNLTKSDDVSDMMIYENYMISPHKMNMQMHMLGVMHAPTNWVTLMLMGSYSKNSMDLKMMSGAEFTTKSRGISDTKFSGLFKITKNKSHKLHANLGVSIPTGSIHLTDDTPMMKNAHLAYPMQTGSGTWDPMVGVTYLGTGKVLSLGTQSKYIMRFMNNKHEYRLGNKFETTGWLVVKAAQSLSFSARLKFTQSNKIQGSDPRFNPMMMPLFNSGSSGVRILGGLLGVNYLVTKGSFKNFRLAAEVSHPLLQNVNGVQMNREWEGIVGVQYAFD